MKLLFFFCVFSISFCYLRAQTKTPNTSFRSTPVSAQKTIEIKKSLNYLKQDVDRLYDSITALRKEISKVTTQLNKKSKLEGLSANENMRLQTLLSQFNQSETRATSVLKKMEDSTNSLIRKFY